MKICGLRFIGLTAVLASLMATGCATPTRLTVTCLGADRFAVGRHQVPLERLPVALRSARATGETEIRVSVPAHVPKTSLAPITRTLESAGYRKWIITRPRQTATSVKKK